MRISMKKTIAFLVAILVAVLILFARLDYSQTSGQVAAPTMGPAPLNAQQRMARYHFLFNRRGLGFGLPHDGFRKAVAQRRAMAARAETVIPDTPPPTWTFIGPQPIKTEIANFGGFTFGTGFNANGRVTAIAVDPKGNVYVGTAGGGVWLSTDKIGRAHV